jgi:hypothetical protein
VVGVEVVVIVTVASGVIGVGVVVGAEVVFFFFPPF